MATDPRKLCPGAARLAWHVARCACLILGFALPMGCGSSGSVSSTSSLRIVTSTAPGATVGAPYTTTLTAEGGDAEDLTWRVVDGMLPPGVRLDAVARRTWGAFRTVGALDAGLEAPRLDEVSGLALSRRNPGVLWVHDDSGAPAEVHALDADGAHLRSYRLSVTAIDWEDLTLGPGPDPSKEYLYIGDVGDNGSRRPHVSILRIEEPLVTAGATVDVAHERFVLTYPDQAHDCETLVMDWATGAPYLIEKSENGGDAFRVPVPHDVGWDETTPGQVIAVTTGRPLPASITGGDAARNGDRLYFRSYLPVGYQLVRPAGGAFGELFGATPTTFGLGFALQQYEALAVNATDRFLATTTERAIFPAAPVLAADAASTAPTSVLRGTPTASGTFRFTVEARNGSGHVATRDLELVVVAP